MLGLRMRVVRFENGDDLVREWEWSDLRMGMIWLENGNGLVRELEWEGTGVWICSLVKLLCGRYQGRELVCEFKRSKSKNQTTLTQALMNKGLLQTHVEASLIWRLGQNSHKGSRSLGLY